MKKKLSKSFSKLGAISGILAGFVALTIAVLGQETKPAESDRVKPAQAEKFADTSDLMIPWRSIRDTCSAFTPNPKPNCPEVWGNVWEAHFLTLYNSDGSVWYQFSVEPRDPRYYLGSPKLQFQPFGAKEGVLDYYPEGRTNSAFKPLGPASYYYPNGQRFSPSLVILRLARESPNWYEVEINEETRETKFIAKTDPLWAKVTWGDIFNMSFNVVMDTTRTKVLDKPDGKALPDCEEKPHHEFQFTKLDGDWMFVNGKFPSESSCKGWIRWRSGRDILVGSILNGRKAPEVKTAETP